MTTRSSWLLVLFVLLVVGGLATLWFFQNFEKQEYTITTGSSPQARSNPLLAAQEYLQESGVRSESVKGIGLLADLPPPTDALIIRHLPTGLSKTLISNMLTWVEQGGHLVVVPHRNAMESDNPGRTTLFEQLGVAYAEKVEDDCGCPPEEDDTAVTTTESEQLPTDNGDQNKEKSAQPDEKGPSGPRNWLITTELDGQSVQLETLRPRLLRDTADSASLSINGSYITEYEEEEDKLHSDHSALKEREGDWLLQYKLGAGRVTVLSEMHLFTNYRIGDYDHAYFLSWLTRDDDTIWLLHSTNVEPFLKILWNKVPLFWVSLAVLMILLVWHLQMQSGSLLRPSLDERQNIMEHIGATAHYNWRTSGFSTMVSKNRKILWNMLIGRKMGLQPNHQKIDLDISRLSQKTGMTENELHSAFQKPIETEQDLIQSSGFMQQIHVHISGGEKKEK